MLWFVVASFYSLNVFAGDLAQAPTAFSYSNGQAIYVDFTQATYDIRYDVAARAATVKTKINFTANTAGFPIFDLAVEPSRLELNGKPAAQALIGTPDRATQLRVVTTSVVAGNHVLEIESPLTTLVEWDSSGVRSAFWSTDLTDRGYLERYLPANMEFDRVPMTLNVEFVGAAPQRIYANGVVTEKKANRFQVKFPSGFTSSSMFFHTAPVGAFEETSFTIRSKDGRDLPVVIYLKPGMFGGAQSTLERLKQNTINIINELEADYGPFLHPSITIYNAGSGGMEYCGATMTSASALGHELTHSYFARGLMPANGNAGWIDEALASWRDNGYPRSATLLGAVNMAGRASYTRFTDRAAYTNGARFMSHIDGKTAAQGGLKSLLRELVAEKAFRPFTTEEFIGWSEKHFGMEMNSEFRKWVYGAGKAAMDSHEENPIHRKMTLEELRDHL